jgi:hypothetical protein
MNHLKIGTRLGFAFALVLLITAMLAAVGISRLGTLKAASQVMATTQMERSSLAQRWESNINVNWIRAAASLRATDPTYIESLQKDMDATSAVIGELQKKLEAVLESEIAEGLMADVAKTREQYRQARAELLKKKKAGVDVSAQIDRDLRPKADS